MSPYSVEVFEDIVGPPAPVITSLSPTSGIAGTSVTIAGASFGTSQGTSIVRFNGTAATVTSWSATSIVAAVPSGATTGPVVVTVNSVASNAVQFTVGAPSTPTLTSLSPTSGTIGTVVTIAGANFGVTKGTSTVRFNGTTAATTSWSSTSIIASVPSGATTGPVVVMVNGVASNGVTFTVSTPGTLPAPWTTQDVGSPALPGQASYASSTFTVTGAGVDIWGTTDQFRFVYQQLTGNGEIVARVDSLQNTSPWAKAGVMMRQDLSGNSPHANVFLTPSAGTAFEWRTTQGGSSSGTGHFAGTAPRWVRLVRSGNTFSGYYSATGTAWTLMGSTTISMPSQVYIGLDVTSINPSVTMTSTFTNVTVSSATPPPNGAPVLTQPTNQTSAEGASVSLQLTASDPDGNPLTYSATGLPPSLTVNPTTGVISGTLTFTSAGSYTVTATASDNALSNSKTFTWTVTDVNTAPTLTGLSPSSGAIGTAVTIAGANFGSTQGSSTVRFNGTTATVTSWSATGIVAPVPSGATTGPVVVTVNGVASNGVTFTVSTPGTLPAPWATQDVGNPALPGQATYASGIFSVSGGGVDIWDTTDQFRFVYQPLNGNGEIVGLVTSLQYTDYWAKAGLMIREDLTSNAPNVVAQLTGGHGTSFQWRTTRGGVSNYVGGFPSAAPRWVRLVRAGNTFSGYYSATGTAWTLMSTTTVAMPAQVYIGLAVTSHNPSVITTGTFTNVSVTGGVPPSNGAPTLTQPTNQTSAEGASVSLQLTASDPDGNPLTYSATGLPPALTVNPTTGVISGTLTFTSAGSYTVTATASDGTLSNSKTFSWTVTDVPQTPTITSLSPISGAVGDAVTITGANFGSTQGTSTVRFNGTTATVTSWSATSIVAAIPSGATTGPLVVTINSVTSNGVTFTVTTPGPLPAPWTTQDIGSPVVAGGATYAAGSFMVTGAGTDIWGGSDQFRFVYRTLDGDGEIAARVDSLGNTDPWAKAGVMIRRDLKANSPNVMAPVTAGNATTLQRRASRGGATAMTSGFGGAAPQWVRLVRNGDTVSGYHSPDGSAWTLMGTYTVSLPPRVYIGLAVTSHNPSVTASATFTNVTVTGGASLTSPLMTESADHEIIETGSTHMLPARGLAPTDYDGDGRTDVATYRPSTGEWHILKSSDNYATPSAIPWGTATDLPVPGDYDGDRKTDIAYYRPASGEWAILNSGSNYATTFSVLLGTNSDVPVPADYDGDGATDIAVYSPATGQWRVLTSSTSYTSGIASRWGSATDIPVTGDYDGDRKNDLAVYRPSTGEWRIQYSGTGYATNATIVLGNRSDILVPADYDGDGLTDAATFEPSTGKWRIRLSTTTVTTVVATLGARTDAPISGDYDGDGRADPSVFHSGTWQILYSSLNYESGIAVSWARDTDTPLPVGP